MYLQISNYYKDVIFVKFISKQYNLLTATNIAFLATSIPQSILIPTCFLKFFPNIIFSRLYTGPSNFTGSGRIIRPQSLNFLLATSCSENLKV